MKNRLLFGLMVFSINICAQKSTTFESYFQTIESNQYVKILHTSMKLTISDINVVITIETNDKLQSLLFEDCVNWNVSVDCLKSYVNKKEITYWPKINKLMIVDLNSNVISTYYSSIPPIINIER